MSGAVSLTLSSVPKISLKPHIFCNLYNPVPSKRTKRRNHLRPKILKTITKPFPSSTPTNPLTPIESSPEPKPLDVVVFEPPSNEVSNLVLEEINKVEDFQCVTGENSGNFGKVSILKFGFCFVGIFMFQTLIAVWVMGKGNSKDKDENLRDNRSKNVKFFNNGKVGLSSRTILNCDHSELAGKVEEIRAMAREARIIEKKGSKNGDKEEDDDMLDETLNLNSKSRIGIEKEIGARLNKLEKKLNSKENFPGSYTNFLDKLKDGGEDVKEMSKTLFVKKKSKFRGPEMCPRSAAKGFSGLKDGSKSSNKNGVATNVSRVEEVDDGKTVVSQNSDFLQSSREKIEHNNTSAGSESGEKRPSTETMKSMKSRDLDTQHRNIYTKENQKAKTKTNKCTSKRKDVNNKPRTDKVKDNRSGIKTDPWWLNLPYVLDNRSGIKTDPWWLNLPYVLVILMQRGVDPEGLGGLFTMRLSSEGQEHSETSCAVAFEDRGDANNFCYLLECFFEDLGDFSAEVVPMFVKELCEVVNSGASEVIVVKKGQLKLYAGQAFIEVEMALQSLIEENNQSASIANSE